MNKKTVTMADVAARCGVSIATVSRVLNEPDLVRVDLRTRVESAMEETGYPRTPAASRARPPKLGLIVPDVINPWLAATIHAAQDEAARQGAMLAIMDVSQDQKLQERHLRDSRTWGLDGLVVIGTKLPPDTYVAYHRAAGIPVVMSRMVAVPELPCILIDYEGATLQAMRHLASLGHRRIACMSDLPVWDSSQIKLKSMRRGLESLGLSLPADLYTWCFPNIAEGVQAAEKLLALPPDTRPTAMFAFDDLIAIGALHAARQRGLRIPEDLSIVGFNDNEMSSYTAPPLTTVALPTWQIGQTLVKKTCEIIRAGGTGNSGGLTAVRCSLVVRESTGPCPVS